MYYLTKRKKLIKIAKEKFNDPNTPTQEQINARETIIRAVAMSNNQLIKANNLSTGAAAATSNLTPTIHDTTTTATMTMTASPATTKTSSSSSSTNQHETFVNNVFSQMNYNDYKKQKIKSLETAIWHRVTEHNLKNSAKKDKHISTICEKKKIHI